MLDGCGRRLTGGIAAVAGFAALQLAPLGCGEETESRPPPIADCDEPGCAGARPQRPVGSGIGNGAGEAGAGGGGGAGGSGMPGPGAGILAGSVVELYTSDLSRTQNLRGEVEVRAPDTEGDDTIAVDPDANGVYRLEGVFVGQGVWVGVGVFSGPPSALYMDTLQTVNSTLSDFVNLLVVRRDVMTDIAAAAFITNPLELDDSLAHAVIRFVSEAGTPLDGVSLVYPLPGDVPVAYDAGDTYSDTLDQTATRGTALLVNLPAPAYPGRAEGIVAELAGVQFTAQVQLARGAVTVVSAVVPSP